MSTFAERRLGWWESWRIFWSISWLPWAVGMFVTMEAASLFTMDQLQAMAPVVGGLFQLLYFAGHVLLIPRMARKQYRGFRLRVVRQEGSGGPLAPVEWIPVAVRIVVPQVVLIGASAVAGNLLALTGDPKLLQSLSSLVRTIHLFGVGPLAVTYAVHAHYARFRFRVE